MVQVRVVEVLAAISLTTDIAGGMPFEKGPAHHPGGDRVRPTARPRAARETVVPRTALLRSIGCTSYSSENADYAATTRSARTPVPAPRCS